ncbi:antibiotic biosynthesis monooxygenase [Kaistia sp. 32K]|uniref:putative quinol monooxygenase n=1 Tax=Kaistia sp. 32K TaxID=2795690 RepID=UPI0019161EF3|nr:putative quinol monooxygenase [Kaistia sp. 32K]BCP53983.1 antibiotic biosynthesis monooxygenase [Kaistia sp. 32K]
MTQANTKPPHILYAEFTAVAGKEDVVKGLLAKFTEDVRSEPGNIDFTCYTHREKPSRFFVCEIYRDRAAFEAHIATPHCAEFNVRVAPYIVEPRTELTFLDPLTAPEDGVEP